MGNQKKTMGFKIALSTVVVAVLAIVGWLVWSPPKAEDSSPSHSVPMSVLSLDGSPLDGVRVTPPSFSEESLLGVKQTMLDVPTSMGLDVLMGLPVELNREQPLPTEGVLLKRQFAEPLPEGVVASFLYFDEDLGAWFPVLTDISPDRLSMTATVHHFSLWNSLVAGTKEAINGIKDSGKKAGQAVGDAYAIVHQWAQNVADGAGDFAVEAAEWGYYAAGSVLGTRTEQPKCKDPIPKWMDSVVHMQDDKNNPIRFCAGSTASGNLVVKASVNRSYAFPYTTKTDPVSIENSADSLSLANIKNVVLNVDASIVKSMTGLFSAQGIVAPGETLTTIYTQDAIAKAKDPLVLALQQPDLPTFLVSMSTFVIVDTGLSMADGALVATLSIGQCAADILSAGNLADAASGLASCLINQSESASKLVVNGMLAKGASQKVAATAARRIGSVSLWAVLLSASSAGIDYVAQSQTSDASLQVSAFAKIHTSVRKPWDNTATEVVVVDPWNNSQVERIAPVSGEETVAGCIAPSGPSKMMSCITDSRCAIGPDGTAALCLSDLHGGDSRAAFNINKWTLKKENPELGFDNSGSGQDESLIFVTAIKLVDGRVCFGSNAEGAEPPRGYSRLWGICNDGQIVWVTDAAEESGQFGNPFIPSSGQARLEVAVGDNYGEDHILVEVATIYL